MEKLYLFICMAEMLLSYSNNHTCISMKRKKYTEKQGALLQNGWTAKFGYKPKFGLQDNYFDIVKGSCVAVKIMDMKTKCCISFVLVNENSTVTVSQIPQGKYYLKLAYGRDWMQYDIDSTIVGKFTTNSYYEKSRDVSDFARKTSLRAVNYVLEINVKNASMKKLLDSVDK